MAVGLWLLDECFSNSEATKTIVYYLVQPVDSQLSLPRRNNRRSRRGRAGNYMVIVPREAIARANVQLGLGQHDC